MCDLDGNHLECIEPTAAGRQAGAHWQAREVADRAKSAPATQEEFPFFNPSPEKRKKHMSRRMYVQVAGAMTVCAAAVIVLSVPSSPRAHAEAGGDSRVQMGLNAAPVPLNMAGKNVALVGLGSYYVNVVGDCNG